MLSPRDEQSSGPVLQAIPASVEMCVGAVASCAHNKKMSLKCLLDTVPGAGEIAVDKAEETLIGFLF